MRALNPFTGAFYLEALQMSRMTREMFCLMEGRHVHPSTLYPGGVGTVPTVQLFTDYIVRLMKYVEFMKKVVPLHDDLFDFFYEALRVTKKVGQRRVLLGCWGSFNDPDVCDYTYKNMNEWGRAMYVTPGVVVDGKLVTTDLVDINLEHPYSAGQFLLRRLAKWRDLRQDRSARQSGRSAASLEPDHDSPAAEARFQRQIYLGDVAALVRQAHRRPSRARHRRRADRALLGDRLAGLVDIGYVKATGHSVKIYLPKTLRCPKWSSNGRFRSGATPSNAIVLALISRPTPPLRRCTSPRRRSKELHAGRHQNLDRFQGAG